MMCGGSVQGMMPIAPDVTDLIGETPLVQLEGFAPNLVGKLEGFNPANSVKDRIGDAMLDRAKRRGDIGADTTIIEPTSGNTGIGLAMAAAARDLDLVIVMPDSMSEERRTLLAALDADIVLTDGDEGMSGAVDVASYLADRIDDSFLPGQFENPANPAIHRQTTGPEIWEGTDGTVDAVVAGVGTGGTITGVSEYFKEEIDADVRSVGVEPAGSAVLSGEEPGSHSIQGIGAGFVPDILRTELLDDVITVEQSTAVQRTRELAREAGILAGISAGAVLEAGIRVASEDEDELVVTVIPDIGERYLSTDLFAAAETLHVGETEPDQLVAALD